MQGPGARMAVCHGPRGVGVAIGAIRASREQQNILQAIQFDGGSQGKFLITAAFAIAFEGYGGLPTGNQASRRTDRMPRSSDFFCQRGVYLSHFSRFSGNIRRKYQRPIAGLPGCACRRQAGLVIGAHDKINYLIKFRGPRLGSFRGLTV